MSNFSLLPVVFVITFSHLAKAEILCSTATKKQSEASEMLDQIVDASTFIDQVAEKGFLALSFERSMRKSDVEYFVLKKSKNPKVLAMQKIVEKLSLEDEPALHALFLLESLRFSTSAKEFKPELTEAIDRLEPLLRKEGLIRNDSSGIAWQLEPSTSGTILSAPAAGKLLDKLVASPAQTILKETKKKFREEAHSSEKAEEAVKDMQVLKAFIKKVNSEFGVELLYPKEFMNDLITFNSLRANGGIQLVFGESPVPQAIRSAFGEIRYSNSTMSRSSAQKVLEFYKTKLGLVRTFHRLGGSHHEEVSVYSVTQLPNGKKLPQAAEIEAVLGDSEILDLMKQVPKDVRKGIKLQ